MSALRIERIPAAIQAMPMLRSLPAEARRQIEAIATLREYGRGDVIWNTGDAAETLTLIVKGRVKIVRHGGGTDMILEIFGVGEPVGVVAVHNRMRYPATAIALEATTLLRVPARDYLDLVERHPELSRTLISDMTRRYLTLTRKLVESRSHPVEARIAQLFLSLAERMGESGEGGTTIPMRLSRQEVAELVGTTVESAIRVLSRWGREGLLVTGQARFVIPSCERLRAVAAATPSLPPPASDADR
ncbi:MAG: Crp/Fnr family transcriptional regulator [Candidatus Eisenbacteria bacterium]|uniref:Crp/Fnr family transcriptional regulator n=1 Tax=Eiseniibacteriota bacterium TaxID=2212470 RepID=A0A849SMU8_UNCEI|nr:Crp/Fnr family transcriptional regulator [Candidatus Eisenbacteria bacterium]